MLWRSPVPRRLVLLFSPVQRRERVRAREGEEGPREEAQAWVTFLMLLVGVPALLLIMISLAYWLGRAAGS